MFDNTTSNPTDQIHDGCILIKTCRYSADHQTCQQKHGLSGQHVYQTLLACVFPKEWCLLPLSVFWSLFWKGHVLYWHNHIIHIMKWTKWLVTHLYSSFCNVRLNMERFSVILWAQLKRSQPQLGIRYFLGGGGNLKNFHSLKLCSSHTLNIKRHKYIFPVSLLDQQIVGKSAMNQILKKINFFFIQQRN